MSSAGIRSRTTALVVVVVTLVWLLAAAFTWRSAQREAAEVFDGHLAQAASMLIAQTAIEIEEPEELEGEIHARTPQRYARRVAFQVWAHGHELLVHSENAPNSRLSASDDGFSDSTVDGQRWRVFSGWNRRHDLLVQVGEHAEARDDMAHELAEGLLGPLLLLLPVLALLIWIAVGYAIRPLRALAAEIADRSPDRLDPLAGLPVPAEVTPLVARLNALLARVESALQAEKRFTGDAAHELRTPIAAVAAQAEVALGASDEFQRRRALEAVLQAARRMGRLVEQLLTLARADSVLPAQWPEIDLAGVARELIAEAAPAAIEDGIELSLDAPDALRIRAEEAWMRILMRNLLDNALRHTAAGGEVGMRLRAEGGEAILELQDEGPGVAAPERLGERFWRERPGGGGSGLGLSIVRRVAELHGATLEFGNRPERSGLVARLRFSLPAEIGPV